MRLGVLVLTSSARRRVLTDKQQHPFRVGRWRSMRGIRKGWDSGHLSAHWPYFPPLASMYAVKLINVMVDHACSAAVWRLFEYFRAFLSIYICSSGALLSAFASYGHFIGTSSPTLGLISRI
jgi:hypothetical protein